MIPFIQLCLQLRQEIENGTFTETLPSIRELSQTYQIGESTVKRALNRLKEMEYVSGLQGKCVCINAKARNNPFFRRNIVIYTALKNLLQPFYMGMIREASQLLRNQYALIHIISSCDQLVKCNFVPDALVALEVTDKKELQTLATIVPAKQLVRVCSNSSDFLCVKTDNRLAGKMAFEVLHDRFGHNHIGVVGCQLDYSYGASRLRTDGIQEAAAGHHEVQLEIVDTDEYPAPDCAVRKLLDRNPKITAIFATMDLLALGVYHECAKRSIRIPEDISVLGFDNRDFTPFMTPPLSTFQENAIVGAEKLFCFLKKILLGQVAQETSFINPMLIERESVAPCRNTTPQKHNP